MVPQPTGESIMFQCQECGKKFKSEGAAWRASMNGCPNCGGTDIDLAVEEDEAREDADADAD
jgi:predicted  nucleic acid-binding Zn-ribbon protein